MEIFAATLVCLLGAFAAMSLGAMLGRPPLRRSCGTGAGEGLGCDACETPCPHRRAGGREDA
jgi:hypothetical protein